MHRLVCTKNVRIRLPKCLAILIRKQMRMKVMFPKPAWQVITGLKKDCRLAVRLKDAHHTPAAD